MPVAHRVEQEFRQRRPGPAHLAKAGHAQDVLLRTAQKTLSIPGGGVLDGDLYPHGRLNPRTDA